MVNQSVDLLGEVLIAPLEHVIAQVGQGIAQAQGAIDHNSMAIQQKIVGDPSLKNLGIEAPWYHMAEVTFDLKMMLTVVSEQTIGEMGAPVQHRVMASLFNASYQNNFNIDASGTSQVRVKMVSIPPPPRKEG